LIDNKVKYEVERNLDILRFLGGVIEDDSLESWTAHRDEACARQILRLMKDPELYERIRENGRHKIEERFNFEVVVDKIEDSLREAAG
jgi:glycosyltransferase involved in cell wall biosynthesis